MQMEGLGLRFYFGAITRLKKKKEMINSLKKH